MTHSLPQAAAIGFWLYVAAFGCEPAIHWHKVRGEPMPRGAATVQLSDGRTASNPHGYAKSRRWLGWAKEHAGRLVLTSSDRPAENQEDRDWLTAMTERKATTE